MEILEVDKKVGKVYFSNCPNCKKYIVNIKKDTVTCTNCRKKYKVQYSEEK